MRPSGWILSGPVAMSPLAAAALTTDRSGRARSKNDHDASDDPTTPYSRVGCAATLARSLGSASSSPSAVRTGGAWASSVPQVHTAASCGSHASTAVALSDESDSTPPACASRADDVRRAGRAAQSTTVSAPVIPPTTTAALVFFSGFATTTPRDASDVNCAAPSLASSSGLGASPCFSGKNAGSSRAQLRIASRGARPGDAARFLRPLEVVFQNSVRRASTAAPRPASSDAAAAAAFSSESAAGASGFEAASRADDPAPPSTSIETAGGGGGGPATPPSVVVVVA
mmetsp:Transcript_11149/g.45171  ORF Transcript_11149/g.45171 Transcript_11149/m.45171 type:complete len:286 (-) Transcript_11149:572-1429(-)